MPPPTSYESDTPRPVNRLDGESSAYLRQHRHNPVDWYPWGDEALLRARAENRPLLVSIGYSACHWCHVMERESFEDPAVAARMNAAFVNIKVDREERPDLDQIYMDTALKLNGHGGWPLNVICTPDGRPFFAGTYYPPQSREGTPSWTDVIEAVSRAWQDQRDEIETNANQIAEALMARAEGTAAGQLVPELVSRAAATLMQNADRAHGGFGRGPKFPTPTNLDFLCAALDFLEPEDATAVAQFLTTTAREMSRRGLYDQIGGGFHRYCVDGNWTIPHFEKMLYDQGLLLSFYAELARRSHDATDFLWPLRETAQYLRREMRADRGAFFASQDADSEGEEGKFFVWTPAEVEAVLGKRANAFCTAYGVRGAGNFERGTTQLVDEARGDRAQFETERSQLYAARAKRIAPATDPKHVTAWNAYAISGLARAAEVAGEPRMLEDAAGAATFLLEEMIDDRGRLMRVHASGRAHIPAFLDDHAALLGACLDLQRAGAGHRFLEPALWLAETILERFADRETGALFFTASDAEPLIHRPRSDQDGATPDAAGLAMLGLVRLGALSHSEAIDGFIERAHAEQAVALERTPHAFPTLLRALALRTRGLTVAVIVGAADDSRTEAMAQRARRVFRPEDAVLVTAPGAPPPRGVDASWLEHRALHDDRPTAYVCRGRACSAPITNPAQLVDDLSLEAPA